MIILLEPHSSHVDSSDSTFERLESLGFDVTQITETERCLSYLSRVNPLPELVLIEAETFDNDAYLAAAKIKALPSASNLPIIFMLHRHPSMRLPIV